MLRLIKRTVTEHKTNCQKERKKKCQDAKHQPSHDPSQSPITNRGASGAMPESQVYATESGKSGATYAPLLFPRFEQAWRPLLRVGLSQ